MQTEFVRRKCDWCDTHADYPKSPEISAEMAESISQWIAMRREFNVGGQVIPIVKHACKESCAQNLLKTGALELPKEFQPHHA